MERKHIIGLSIGVVALIALTAGASAFVATQVMHEKPAVTASTTHHKSSHITWNDQQSAQAQPAQPACDDGNVVGYVLGGVGGGVVGNQLGKGKGNTATTIGGTLGGAYLGGQYIPTRNVTCRR